MHWKHMETLWCHQGKASWEHGVLFLSSLKESSVLRTVLGTQQVLSIFVAWMNTCHVVTDVRLVSPRISEGPRLHHRGLDTSLQRFCPSWAFWRLWVQAESTSSWLSYKTRMSEICLPSQAKGTMIASRGPYGKAGPNNSPRSGVPKPGASH